MNSTYLCSKSWEGSIAVNSLLVHLPFDPKAFTIKSAQSSLFITPLASLSSVKTAFPVAGWLFKPPGRIIVQSFC